MSDLQFLEDLENLLQADAAAINVIAIQKIFAQMIQNSASLSARHFWQALSVWFSLHEVEWSELEHYLLQVKSLLLLALNADEPVRHGQDFLNLLLEKPFDTEILNKFCTSEFLSQLCNLRPGYPQGLPDLYTFANELAGYPHEQKYLQYYYCQRISEESSEGRHQREDLEIHLLNDRVEYLQENLVSFSIMNHSLKEGTLLSVSLLPSPLIEVENEITQPVKVSAVGEQVIVDWYAHVHVHNGAKLDLAVSYEGISVPLISRFAVPVYHPQDYAYQIRKNPYDYGPAIQNPNKFFGRETEIRKIISSLVGSGHTNFILTGPRRIGKTSMLHAINNVIERIDVRKRYQLPSEWYSDLNRFHPVFVSLQGIDLEEERIQGASRQFFAYLLKHIYYTIAPHMTERALSRLEQACLSLSIGDAFQNELNEFFDTFPNEKIVMLVDEFDELYRPGMDELKIALRHVIQQNEKITWIFTSTYFSTYEQADYGSPWFNILDILPVDVLDLEAAKQLVLEPSREERVYWENAAQAYLIEQTGCHPALLQLACKSVIDYLNETHAAVVSVRTVKLVLHNMCESETLSKSYFDTYWISEDMPVLHPIIIVALYQQYPNDLSRTELRNRVKELISSIESKQPSDFIHDFKAALEWGTYTLGALSFNRQKRTYRFKIPLFQQWLDSLDHKQDLLATARTYLQAH